MLNARWSSLIAVGLFSLPLMSAAAVLSEDFSTPPAARGWRTFGDATLFRWNETNRNLEVTWDSTRPNSYFYHPLGTVLAKTDDFSLTFDLRLRDIAGGVVSNRSGPFQIVVGLLNLGQATGPNFRRGTGFDSPNVVEFDYFPAGYYPEWSLFVEPTVSPTIISSSNQFATGFTYPLELSTNAWYRITLAYTASNQTLATTLRLNGETSIPVANATLDANFTDFRVDAVSITSYSDAGNAYDSVLAHGVVDNLEVALPPPPMSRLSGGFTNQLWQVSLSSQTNWFYTLERSPDLVTWATISPRAAGTGGTLSLQETNRAAGAWTFYRVQAERP